MKIKDLMEKLSKMDKNQELIIEGLEDEVETTETEEVVEEPAKHPQEELIDTMVDKKMAMGGTMKAPTRNGDLNNAPTIGKYATSIKSPTDLKKCKVIAKVLAFRDGYMYGVDDQGRTIDAEEYLDEYPKFKQWWDEHKDEIADRYGYWVIEGDDELEDEELDGIECPFCGQKKQEDEMTYYDGDYMCQDCVDNQMNGSSEIDECGSACGKMNESVKTEELAKKYPNLAKAIEEDELIAYIRDRFEDNSDYEDTFIKDVLVEDDLIEDFYSWGHNSRWSIIEGVDQQILINELLDWLNKGEISDEQKMNESNDSAESIEVRLNEQMKSDYQKELEAISDFLF